MGVTSPLWLLAAALVALPVIAHLVRKSEVSRRILPTVALLRRVVVRDRRRARVTEPWLLAVRIALVLASVLALASPYAVVDLPYGDGSSLAIALILDDSMSMAQRDERGEPAIDRALERAREIVRSVGNGSEIALVASGRPARLLVPRTTDRSAVLRALDGIRIGARRDDDERAVQMALRQLAAARLAARRIVVISDFAGETGDAFRSGTHGDTSLELVPVLDGARGNVAVTDVQLVRDPLEAGAVALEIEWSASGNEPGSRGLSVLALAPGTGRPGPGALELARTSFRIEPGAGRGRVGLRVRPPDETGYLAVRLDSSDEDALAEDDERVVPMRGPDPVRVVVVEPAGSRTGRFFARALATAEGFFTTTVDVDRMAVSSGSASTTSRDRAGDAADPFAGADVVVLAGVVPSSPASQAALRAFLDEGGGMLVAPSAATRSVDFTALEDLLPARVVDVEAAAVGQDALRLPTDRLRGTPDTAGSEPSGAARSNSRVRLGPASLLPSGTTGLEGLIARSRLVLRAPDERVALAFSDGAPLLVVDAASRRALIGVSLDETMSDLPFRPGFVPLAHMLARSLARPGTLPSRVFHGGEVPPIRMARDVASLEIITPSGEVIPRNPSAGMVPLDDLFAAGVYELRAVGARGSERLDRASFVVVPPPEESVLEPRVPELSGLVGRAEGGGRTQRPLDRWLYLALGVLAALEAFVRLGRAFPTSRSKRFLSPASGPAP